MFFGHFFAALLLLGVAQAMPTAQPSNETELETHILNRRYDCGLHTNAPVTWYDKGTDPHQITACGAKLDTSKLWVALPNTISNPKQYCGWTMFIIGTKGTDKVISATVMDVNATPTMGKNQLDLTPAAYKALFGSTSKAGRVTWYLWNPSKGCYGL